MQNHIDCGSGEYHASVEAVIRKHSQDILNWLIYVFKVGEKAEDIRQEVYIKIFMYYKNFRGESGLRTWLYAVTRNLVYEQSRRHTPAICDLEPWKNESATMSHPAFFYRGDRHIENKIYLEEILSQNEPKKAKALTHHFGDGLTYGETAALMKTTAATTKMLLHRTRARIKRKYPPPNWAD